MATEGITVTFTEEGVDLICQCKLGFRVWWTEAWLLDAEEINLSTENIGARRLHSILERIMEDISYNGPDSEQKEYIIDEGYVRDSLKDYVVKHDYTKYLL